MASDERGEAAGGRQARRGVKAGYVIRVYVMEREAVSEDDAAACEGRGEREANGRLCRLKGTTAVDAVRCAGTSRALAGERLSSSMLLLRMLLPVCAVCEETESAQW